MTQTVSEPPAAVLDRPKTVPDIVRAAGGAVAIASASVEAASETISAEAVYKWPKIGIPDRHWGLLMSLCDVTPDELYAANIAARTPADFNQSSIA